MQKKLGVVLLLLFAIILVSCSDFWDKRNKLTVTNDALFPVTFTFRGVDHDLSSGDKVVLEGSEVPPGIFVYNTAYQYPAGATVVEGDGIAGTLDFTQKAITASMKYISAYTSDSTGITYEIGAVYSSTEDGSL